MSARLHTYVGSCSLRAVDMFEMKCLYLPKTRQLYVRPACEIVSSRGDYCCCVRAQQLF